MDSTKKTARSAGIFYLAHQLVSWISWMPNLMVAYFIVKRNFNHSKPTL